jgi:hypothetical protein
MPNRIVCLVGVVVRGEHVHSYRREQHQENRQHANHFQENDFHANNRLEHTAQFTVAAQQDPGTQEAKRLRLAGGKEAEINGEQYAEPQLPALVFCRVAA